MKTQNNKLAFQKNAIVELDIQQLHAIDSGQDAKPDPTIIFGGGIIICTISATCPDDTIYQGGPYNPDTQLF